VNPDDLLRMLDLSGKEATPSDEAGPGLDITPDTPPPSSPASPTALELDGWALRLGRELLDESERLQSLDLGEHAVADFHALAFEPEPRIVEHCDDRQRHQFVGQLLETPGYRALHSSTTLDGVASSIAAAAFAEQFAGLRKEDDPGKDPLDREMKSLRAVGRALAEAGGAVEEQREAEAACGLGPGSPGGNDPGRIAGLYRRVRGNATLRRVMEQAGRYRRLAQSRQRRKLAHGTDDVVGVVLDGDLGRLLPHELAKLAIPELEDDVFRRVVERQAMCRLHRASEPVGKGPVIVAVDESGSMEGEKGHAAKALTLAMAWVARRQGRWCALVAYSGDSGERLLALPPGRWDEPALLDWLSAFIGRGSSIDVPVRELPDYYRRLNAPAGRTDVLFVTDAQCRLPDEVRDRFNDWKREVRARLVTLVIGGSAGDLSSVSDEVHLVRSLAVTEDAVGRALSV
jgi:uncharacterized protein with von Willebrand factor type A (vWA) domain